MVGNDIIDIELAKTQSNWQRPRYLDKIFTLEEQDLIEYSEAPNLMVWQLWSMKEAAYKLYTQLHPSRFYNPKAFACTIDNGRLVTYKAFKCHVNTKSTSKYIVSEAHAKQQNINSEVVCLSVTSSKAQSKILRDRILSLVSQQWHCDKKDIKFVKRKYGIPTIQVNRKDINISLSHHGRFGAIAFAR
ncbi:4'-phosphopantetheinyl transferase superfamily protein [Winogradskyella sp.]|uniref:4'-phosphopantetheinyl transferase family protein n=1 Tax=Winogradskyella sp. TaxID=1883156 RepID=UPI002610EE90|nr:4'-phosphopantetheinyl transferase superfamily protein [Winogradskyella sp.]